MSAFLPAAADAVVTAINAATLVRAVEARRSYLGADIQLRETGRTRVDVTFDPEAVRVEWVTQSALRFTYTVDVLVRHRFQNLADEDDGSEELTVPRTDADELTQLVTEIIEAVGSALAEPTSDPTLDENEGLAVRALWHPAHLREWHQFTGWVRVTLRTDRELTVAE